MDKSFKTFLLDVINHLNESAKIVTIGIDNESETRSLVNSCNKSLLLENITFEDSISEAKKHGYSSVSFVYVSVRPTFEEIHNSVVYWRNNVIRGGFMGGNGYSTNADVQKICEDTFPGFIVIENDYWLIQL